MDFNFLQDQIVVNVLFVIF